MLLSKFTVSGHSMLPIFKPGDQLLISFLPYIFSSPKIGDVVVFKKDNTTMIKKITKITEQGIIVEGENKNDSLDRSVIGIISKKHILGKVILKL